MTGEVIYCGICRKSIFRNPAVPITSRVRIPSRTHSRNSASLLTQMVMDAENAHQEMLAKAEEACAEHFRVQHPLRLRLFRRFHWKWLMQRRWPWGGIKGAEEFDWKPS